VASRIQTHDLASHGTLDIKDWIHIMEIETISSRRALTGPKPSDSTNLLSPSIASVVKHRGSRVIEASAMQAPRISRPLWRFRPNVGPFAADAIER
jgi:hypothetical protein